MTRQKIRILGKTHEVGRDHAALRNAFKQTFDLEARITQYMSFGGVTAAVFLFRNEQVLCMEDESRAIDVVSFRRFCIIGRRRPVYTNAKAFREEVLDKIETF